MTQLIYVLVVLGRVLVDAEQDVCPLVLSALLQGYAGPVGQEPHGFAEVHVLFAHYEGKCVTADPACAKTVPALPLGINDK